MKVDGIEWIRLHYAFPTGFPEDVLEVIVNEPKVCNYIDIPLQHIADPVLKSMRRGTTKAKTDKLLRKFRASVPGMAVRTTLLLRQLSLVTPMVPVEIFQQFSVTITNTKWTFCQNLAGPTVPILVSKY